MTLDGRRSRTPSSSPSPTLPKIVSAFLHQSCCVTQVTVPLLLLILIKYHLLSSRNCAFEVHITNKQSGYGTATVTHHILRDWLSSHPPHPAKAASESSQDSLRKVQIACHPAVFNASYTLHIHWSAQDYSYCRDTAWSGLPIPEGVQP